MKKEVIVQITERKCGLNIQPYIQVGARYALVGRDMTKGGAEVVIIQIGKNTTARCNVRRFSWRIISSDDVLDDLNDVLDTKAHRFIDRNYTLEERIKFSYVPYVIVEIASLYIERSLAMASERKLIATKSLSRDIRDKMSTLNKKLSVLLSFDYRQHLMKQTRQFLTDHVNDFVIFEFCSKQQMLNEHPNDEDNDIKTYALMAYIVLRYYQEYCMNIAKIICKATGGHSSDDICLPVIHKIMPLLLQFANVKESINLTDDITRCIKILNKNITTTQFTLSD